MLSYSTKIKEKSKGYHPSININHLHNNFLLVYKRCSACLYNTFHNISVTVTGIRDFEIIDGCFEPEKNVEKVSLIQILNQSVPILYEGAFNNLEYLVDIILEYDEIKEIKPGAFKNLPKIYLIRLKHNGFREIREGVFNNLSLSELSLINNKIEVIESKAFDNLPNLSIILLNDNKLRKWDPNWFTGSPKLSVLNFENNLIVTLPRRAFQNIYGVHVVNNLNISTSIHLNNNQIEMLEDGAFDGLNNLGWLFLQKNKIANIRETSLGSLKQLDWLRLDYNNLQCIPEKLTEIAPNVKYYLEGNPLTEECINKYEIRAKNNGFRKINITIN